MEDQGRLFSGEKPKSPLSIRTERLFERIERIKQRNAERKPYSVKLDYLE